MSRLVWRRLGRRQWRIGENLVNRGERKNVVEEGEVGQPERVSSRQGSASSHAFTWRDIPSFNLEFSFIRTNFGLQFSLNGIAPTPYY